MITPRNIGHSAALHALSPDKTARIRSNLLEWYAREARDLPWRLPPVHYHAAPYDEYAHRLYCCLLSEAMLQQTQVQTVIPFYEKWLKTFPTIVHLADASEENVMAAWAGLGYYSRARRLHQAAKHLVSGYITSKAEIPSDTQYWIKNVPGVGPYTAGAIISIAFDMPSAIVDGNVQRVLSRVLAIHGNTSTPKSPGSNLVWERAKELVTGDHPGDLNQSLMELGATVCTPVQPACGNCPVKEECLARGSYVALKRKRKDFFSKAINAKNSPQPIRDIDMEDLCTICPSSIDVLRLPEKPDLYIQNFYPFKSVKKAQREETAIVMVISRGQEVYLEKKEKGLLAGLYDFPTTLLGDDEDLNVVLEERKKDTGARVVGSTLHLFTHIRRTSHVLTCDAEHSLKALDNLKLKINSGRWFTREQIAAAGISELCQKNWRLATGIEKSAKRKLSSASEKKIYKAPKNSQKAASNSAPASSGLQEQLTSDR